MRSVSTSDGLHLAVHEHGGAGRPTLLSHATGFHGAVWEPLSAALGSGFERWALDFRAHGESVVPPGLDLHWSGMGDDVLAVVDGLDLPAGELLGIGHSMGGAALLLAEQARPGTFAGLWLFEPITPPPSLVMAGGDLAERASRRRSTFPSHAAALEHFASKRPLAIARADALHAYVRHGFVPGDDGAVHLACRPEDESQIFRGGGTHGAYDELAAVRCPVVVASGDDPFGPATLGPAVVEALPAGRLERHPNLGHFGPLEAPKVLAESVLVFAASLPGHE
ncbi:MAG: alpha/beta hydrolase [Acidimicrobiales bacterium]